VLALPVCDTLNLMAGGKGLFGVLICDDVPAVREALRWAFEDEPDLAIIGEAGDGLDLLRLASRLAPDVVILDIELPGLDGYSVAQRLKRFQRPPVVIFLTVHCGPAARQRGLEAGGDGFVEKGTGWPELIGQVRYLLTSRFSS
jgi:DNA-binding NarL/FixJ family response regulator